MPNHWHFAVRPKTNGDMGKFFGKFTQKVTQRWHSSHHTAGSGHLFQGRFKSFLVEKDPYFFQLMKYIEANPLRAKIVKEAEEWQWGSLSLRTNSYQTTVLSPWPMDMPKDYLKQVNKPLPKLDLKNIRHAVLRSSPLGNKAWVAGKVEKYDLQYTIRREGRPSAK
jgi:putative transposase